MHSISGVRKGLCNQTKQIDTLTQFTIKYARKTNSLLHQMANQLNHREQEFQAVTTDLALIMVSTKMTSDILTSLTELYQGIIPVLAMTPLEATTIFNNLKEQARTADLHLVLEGPGELFKLEVTTYMKDTNKYKLALSIDPAPPKCDFLCF